MESNGLRKHLIFPIFRTRKIYSFGYYKWKQAVKTMFHVFSALKIHVSPMTKQVLDEFKTFILELRGEVEMKVYSYIYWIDYRQFVRKLPQLVFSKTKW